MRTYISVAEAKARFSDLVSRVTIGGERFIVTRHGKPVVALVNPRDLDCLEREKSSGVELPEPLSEEDYAAFESSIQAVLRERADPGWTRPSALDR